jgi:hypothetical protein
MLAACWRRKSRQAGPERRGAGSRPAASSSRRTVLGDTRRPSFSSSRAIRGYPSVDSRARAAARPDAPHRRRRDGLPFPAAAPTSVEPARGANAGASAASRPSPCRRRCGSTRVSAARKARSAGSKREPPLVPAEHGQLMSQHEQLDLFGEFAAPASDKQPQQGREGEIGEGKEHPPMLAEPTQPTARTARPTTGLEASANQLRSPAGPGTRALANLERQCSRAAVRAEPRILKPLKGRFVDANPGRGSSRR